MVVCCCKAEFNLHNTLLLLSFELLSYRSICSLFETTLRDVTRTRTRTRSHNVIPDLKTHNLQLEFTNFYTWQIFISSISFNFL